MNKTDSTGIYGKYKSAMWSSRMNSKMEGSGVVNELKRGRETVLQGQMEKMKELQLTAQLVLTGYVREQRLAKPVSCI